MFGNDDQNQNSNSALAPNAPATDMPASDTAAGVVAPDEVAAAPAAPEVQADAAVSAPSAPTIPDPMVTPAAQPEAGINGVAMQNAYIEPGPQIGPAKPAEPDSAPTAAAMINTPTPAATDPDLAQIKQQALQSLEPLVGQLDQAPEEKFKTVMMLIQASDNSKMLKEAYGAASQITDEKTRAQALLDIVNEINYFTQQASAKTGQ